MTRLAIASGATSVELEIESRHLRLNAPGARWSREILSDFASLLDPRLGAADRHRAMVELEARDAFVLSAIACSQPRALRLSLGGEGGTCLELESGTKLQVINPLPEASARPDVELRVEGLAIDPQRARQWLARVGRFAAVRVTADGARIDRGFRDVLCQKRYRITQTDAALPPLDVALAVPVRGNAPRLWLLRHGIIATHATVPGYPAFEAAIEMAEVSRRKATQEDPASVEAPRATAAELRELLQPYVEPLVDSAVGLTLGLARRASDLPEDGRARCAQLLLRAALKKRRRPEIAGVEVFPLLDATSEGTPQRRLVSLDTIRRLVRIEAGGASVLDAIPADQVSKERAEAQNFVLTGRGALALSQSERALLGELLDVIFSTPPARARRPLKRRLLNALSDWTPWWRGKGGAMVAEHELSPEERSLLTRLRDATKDGTLPAVELRAGGGRIRRASDGTVLLPRHHPTVRACVHAVSHEPAWLYPAAVALLDGRELPGPEVRRGWFARWDD